MTPDRLIAVSNNKTIYRDGDTCIKVFVHADAKADVFREAHFQSLFEDSELHVPRVLSVGIMDGKWYIESEYIRGNTLDSLLKAQPAQSRFHLQTLIRLQNAVHALSETSLPHLLPDIRQQIQLASIDADTRSRLLERLNSVPQATQVCHGDFVPSNILIQKDGTPYILDWGQARLGPAAYDISRTYLRFLMVDSASLAETYLELSEAEAGIPRRIVEEWLPLSAVMLLPTANQRQRDILLPCIH